MSVPWQCGTFTVMDTSIKLSVFPVMTCINSDFIWSSHKVSFPVILWCSYPYHTHCAVYICMHLAGTKHKYIYIFFAIIIFRYINTISTNQRSHVVWKLTEVWQFECIMTVCLCNALSKLVCYVFCIQDLE